jgi:hypothetical protein
MQISFTNGNEEDALTEAKHFYKWRAGSRAAIKRGYNKRARKVARHELRRVELDA